MKTVFLNSITSFRRAPGVGVKKPICKTAQGNLEVILTIQKDTGGLSGSFKIFRYVLLSINIKVDHSERNPYNAAAACLHCTV